MADVSLVDHSDNGRYIINQNVLFELGYAVGSKGYESIILVANTDLRTLKDLPFDIQGRRVIQFSPLTDKKGQELANSLKYALELHASELRTIGTASDQTDYRKVLIEAIESGAPARSKAVKYFEDLFKRYLELAPHRIKPNEDVKNYSKVVYESFASTKLLAEEFYEVAQLAAEYENIDTVLAAYKGSEAITRYYDINPEDGGRLDHRSREFYELVEYELVSILVGCLADESNWEYIRTLKDVRLRRPEGSGKPRVLKDLYAYPRMTSEYHNELKGLNYAYPMTNLMQERYESKPELLRIYLDGSFALFMLTDGFFPVAVGLLLSGSYEDMVPSYISKLKSKRVVLELMQITGDSSIAKFRGHMKTKFSHSLGSLFAYRYSNLNHILEYEGILKPEDIGALE